MKDPGEIAVQHNYAVIICGEDDVMLSALAAGFMVVGAWPSSGPGSLGSPTPSMKLALRRTMMTPLAGVVDCWKGEKVPEEWFR